MSRIPHVVLACLACLLVLGGALAPSYAGGPDPLPHLPIEPFAPYQPATGCHPAPKPGTLMLGHWLVHRFGGGFGPISRPCTKGGAVSEHTEGRAFDWMNDAASPVDRARVAAMMQVLFDTDAQGDQDALARRMGIMYLIWDDHIYEAWNGFAPRPYLNAACRTLKHCSPTLRHRDHVHFSLDRRAARAQTSWYVERLARAAAGQGEARRTS